MAPSSAKEDIQLPNRPVTLSPRPENLQLSEEVDNEPTPILNPRERYLSTAKDVWRSTYDELREEPSTKALVHAPIISPTSYGGRIIVDCARQLPESVPFHRQDQNDSGKCPLSVPPCFNCMDIDLLAGCTVHRRFWQSVEYTRGANDEQVTQYVNENKENQEGLSYVVSRLPWYNQLIDLLDSDTWASPDKFNGMRAQIRETITKLYTLLIEYQLRSFGTQKYTISTIARQATKWDDWNGKIVKIKEIEQQPMKDNKAYSTVKLQDALNNLLQKSIEVGQSLLNMVQEQSVNIQRIAQIVDQNATRELVNKYKLVHAEFDLTTYNKYIHDLAALEPNTGHGILHHETYTNWMKSDNGLLLLAAGPGTGKSVLAKHLYDCFRGDKMIVCSFFFKDQNPGQTLPRIALCNMLYDLLKQLPPSMINEIRPQIDRLDKEKIQLDSKDLWEIINMASQGSDITSVTFIFDALDESNLEERDAFLKQLSNFHSLFPQAKFKVLLTARPYSGITDKFASGSVLNIEEDPACCQGLEADIAKVTRQKFEVFTVKRGINDKKSLQAKLLEKLEKYNHQNYLVIELLFKYLEKLPQDFNHDWIEIFESLPTTVWETYTTLLNKVDETHRSVVEVIIRIMLAAARSLTVGEMNIAVGLRSKNLQKYDNIDELLSMTDQAFGDLLWKSCDFFFKPVGDYIYFMHPTVKDYLLSSEQSWLQHIDMESCHRDLAEICIKFLSWKFVQDDSRFLTVENYLSIGCVSQETYHRLCQNFPFGKYGFRYWMYHFREGFREAEDLSQQLGPVRDRHPRWSTNFAISVFCCSVLPDHEDVESFLVMIPPGYQNHEEIRIALCSSLIETYWSAGSFPNLLFAIRLAEDTVKITAGDHPKQARILAVLGEGLQRRYNARHKSEMLEMAVQRAQETVKKTPQGHPHYAFVLDRYAQTLLYQYERFREGADIRAVAEFSKKASTEVAGISPPDLAGYMITYSQALLQQASDKRWQGGNRRSPGYRRGNQDREDCCGNAQ
ncbi:hypothetical protein BO71DRAFT_257129 [Aspergillus ellipticus CBS 707.79]|uniref:Uncharacterized protein n=1 Tax=Aspergillus ellipticus CBS 707.79 TaxID=1448320 RepID=A0A319D7R0_9EURO|nr:hypothetical protein BO71DRAFT_257129 [Aspergillus ellipticus CBS 707.79]